MGGRLCALGALNHTSPSTRGVWCATDPHACLNGEAAAGRGPPAPEVVVVVLTPNLLCMVQTPPHLQQCRCPETSRLRSTTRSSSTSLSRYEAMVSYGRSPLVGWLKRRIPGYRPTPLAVRSLTMPARLTGEGPSVPLPGADRLRELHLARCDGLPRQRPDQQGGRPAVFIPAEAPHARD